MELQKQCITLSQSKRLKELGFKKTSYYIRLNHIGIGYEEIYIVEPLQWSALVRWEQPIRAYTAEELGEILPKTQVFNNQEYELNIRYAWWRFCASYVYDSEYSWDSIINESYWPTLAEALGNLLIHLLENNLMKW